MIKNKIVALCLFIVVWIAIWNIGDYLYSSFVTKSTYRFTTGSDLLVPLIVSVVVGYFVLLRRKKD